MSKNELLFFENFLDLNQTIAKKLFENIYYPWEVLPKIKSFILEIGPTLSKDEYDEVSENVWVSKEAKVANSAHIDGPTIIGKGTEIRHCAFIRGSVIVGENCVVGNSTEIKNSILFNSVQVPHFNYVGDSVLGYKAHMGAGSITSNVKSDRTPVTIKTENEKIDTGLKKFGAVLGDHVEIGCNAVLNPGSVLGRSVSVYPTSMVRGLIPENTIFKNTGEKVKKI
ncbi:MAG: UDP-N-acetylglucosamine pyrophosphorylase [Clostridia bacterium]|nr:UDP-N-acetylglucosamine pyrophosphorylase [Clostridia bacterium]